MLVKWTDSIWHKFLYQHIMYVMGIYQSVWRQAHYDVTDENNYELKVSTYIITNIAARSTGLDTILMMMSVSILKTDARLYILFLLY